MIKVKRIKQLQTVVSETHKDFTVDAAKKVKQNQSFLFYLQGETDLVRLNKEVLS